MAVPGPNMLRVYGIVRVRMSKEEILHLTPPMLPFLPAFPRRIFDTDSVRDDKNQDPPLKKGSSRPDHTCVP
jgi:hypothetical protein